MMYQHKKINIYIHNNGYLISRNFLNKSFFTSVKNIEIIGTADTYTTNSTPKNNH